jgi:hypothetical protein
MCSFFRCKIFETFIRTYLVYSSYLLYHYVFMFLVIVSFGKVTADRSKRRGWKDRLINLPMEWCFVTGIWRFSHWIICASNWSSTYCNILYCLRQILCSLIVNPKTTVPVKANQKYTYFCPLMSSNLWDLLQILLQISYV